MRGNAKKLKGKSKLENFKPDMNKKAMRSPFATIPMDKNMLYCKNYFKVPRLAVF